jgi:hypothetical protein
LAWNIPGDAFGAKRAQTSAHMYRATEGGEKVWDVFCGHADMKVGHPKRQVLVSELLADLAQWAYAAEVERIATVTRGLGLERESLNLGNVVYKVGVYAIAKF